MWSWHAELSFHFFLFGAFKADMLSKHLIVDITKDK